MKNKFKSIVKNIIKEETRKLIKEASYKDLTDEEKDFYNTTKCLNRGKVIKVNFPATTIKTKLGWGSGTTPSIPDMSNLLDLYWNNVKDEVLNSILNSSEYLNYEDQLKDISREVGDNERFWDFVNKTGPCPSGNCG